MTSSSTTITAAPSQVPEDAHAPVPPSDPMAGTPTPGASSSVIVGAESGAASRVPLAPAPGHSSAPIVAQPTSVEQQLDASRFVAPTQTHIFKSWMEGFYPIYSVAQETFGVNWLLIASIHRQESAFSTAP